MRIYVDLDETLVHSVYGKGRSAGRRTVIATGDGEDYHSFLRPSAFFLLANLRAMGEVYMLTTATRSYALSHNEKFCLGFCEEEIIAREDYIAKVDMAYSSAWIPLSRKVCPDAVLIDNLPPREEAPRLKMAYLGIREDRYLQIREFNGKDPQRFASELDQLISRVREIVVVPNAPFSPTEKSPLGKQKTGAVRGIGVGQPHFGETLGKSNVSKIDARKSESRLGHGIA